ncbi:MAG: LapA family protein [Nitrospinaceae bacterium]|jgi:uncharacterized integral membrane protein|nr:MAG: LapA family protein [Nitrospinaceae bacterium]
MQAIKVIVTILFLIVVSAFAVKNMGPVDLFYYDLSLHTQSVQLPLMIVILIPFGMGFVLAYLLGWIDRIKLKARIHRQGRRIHALEAEVEELTPKPERAISMPVED